MIDRTIWFSPNTIPTFDFAFVPSEKAWRRTTRLMEWEIDYPCRGAFAGAATTCDRGHPSRVLVTIGTGYKPETAVRMLVHEGCHVWRRLVAFIGEKEPSSEFQCYTTEWICAQLIGAYEKTRGPLLIKGPTHAR